MKMSSPIVDAAKAKLESAGVKYALASYVDMHGISKSKIVPLSHFAQMAAGSELFTGAALDGVPQQVNDEEVAAHPDLDSLAVLPWNKEIAWFASDLHLKGAPFEACSRGILKKVLQEATDLGYRFNLGIETEFFVLKDNPDGSFGPVSERDTLAKPCYDVRGFLDSYGYLDELVQAMDGLGWDVYSFDHEDANGQFETDFMYADGLTMADRFTFFRLMANELAHKRGWFTTFMAKPFGNRTGSGAHYNMSFADLETGENLFVDPSDPHGLKMSKLGYQFIAGVLKHAQAICAVIAPTVNSYKRLVRQGSMSGFTWAPVHVSYGSNNRTNMLRVPLAGGRVECRAVDMSCNPYLAAAMILAAGLEGIREGLDPGAPHAENMYLYSESELHDQGLSYLPRTLGEAVDAFEADPLAAQVMGPLMAKTFADFKRREWLDYHNSVSEWEIKRYLKFF
ncbi:type III glutamate--ammonia ligase [Sulfurimicrobium lacus]|uniref:Type III glutamate--ammonia ligase n=1 Tax=Sulfurimicrobium lacus TaxID=2715678 RepID=A0A6F8V7J0_9PROT|nr:type III glutamate--ammonia ligase [Sulfurimicrobium lacus]BCB25280.1 type III glutamate--ammonia ligase [Sulfurimicrobium lacus]